MSAFNTRLAVIARSARTGMAYRYPLTTEKLLSDTWTPMARFQEPKTPAAWGRIQRHAEAVGGRVRLLRGDMLLATWCEGELVADWREAS
jgi:hypothetical protein